MAIYSYYYGASVEKGINIQAQSKELEGLPVRSALKDLASMHALKSSDHDGEMLSYMLSASGYGILGTSYIESPKSSGYNRSAPCGLMYVAPAAEMAAMAGDLGRIINFVSFQKPGSPSPEPLKEFPLNDSGFSYHSSPSILAPMVDGLLRVAFASDNTVMLIALPKGKSSEYATARYAISEALSNLPAPLRTNIRFFTGLPVAENGNDPLVGFDNAIGFGANVIFCSNEYFARLKSYRSCLTLDMENPTGTVGAFAEYITQVSDVSFGLTAVNGNLSGRVTYDSLNKAAMRAKQGEVRTMEMVCKELANVSSNAAMMQKTNDRLMQDIAKLKSENSKLKNDLANMSSNAAMMQKANNRMAQDMNRNRAQNGRNGAAYAPPAYQYGQQGRNFAPAGNVQEQEEIVQDPVEAKKEKIIRWVLCILIAIVLIAAVALGATLIKEMLEKREANPAGQEIQYTLPAESSVPETADVPGEDADAADVIPQGTDEEPTRDVTANPEAESVEPDGEEQPDADGEDDLNG